MEYKLHSIKPSGYGHKKISIIYRKKELSCITGNMPAVDDYNSEEGERDGRELRIKRGYLTLKQEILRKNNIL